MPRVPTPYNRSADDQPVTRLTYKAQNGRSVVRVLEYPNGDVCMQLEDKLGGAELWGSVYTIVELGHLLVKVGEPV